MFNCSGSTGKRKGIHSGSVSHNFCHTGNKWLLNSLALNIFGSRIIGSGGAVEVLGLDSLGVVGRLLLVIVEADSEEDDGNMLVLVLLVNSILIDVDSSEVDGISEKNND